MPTVHQSTTLTSGSDGTNDGPLAFRAIGIGHNGTIPNWKMTAQVSGGCNRLLHQMGGSRTTGDYYRKEHPKFRMEDNNLQVWGSTSTCVRQREAIRQSQIQTVLPRTRHPQPLFISWPSTSQRTSRGYESVVTQTHQNPTRGGKGTGQKNSQAYSGPTEQQSGYQRAKHHFE